MIMLMSLIEIVVVVLVIVYTHNFNQVDRQPMNVVVVAINTTSMMNN